MNKKCQKGETNQIPLWGYFYNLFSTGNLAGSCGAQGETVCDLKSLETCYIAKNSLHSLTSPWTFAGKFITLPSIQPSIHASVLSLPQHQNLRNDSWSVRHTWKLLDIQDLSFFLGRIFLGHRSWWRVFMDLVASSEWPERPWVLFSQPNFKGEVTLKLSKGHDWEKLEARVILHV